MGAPVSGEELAAKSVEYEEGAEARASGFYTLDRRSRILCPHTLRGLEFGDFNSFPAMTARFPP